MDAFRAHGADGVISRKRGGPSNRALGTVFREIVLTILPRRPVTARDTTSRKAGSRDVGQMDGLTTFGLFAVTAMLVTYALEQRSAWFILAFAGACALGSLYGFLQGAWPFGLVEAIWALVAVRRWKHRR
jgi:hypothetical protein